MSARSSQAVSQARIVMPGLVLGTAFSVAIYWCGEDRAAALALTSQLLTLALTGALSWMMLRPLQDGSRTAGHGIVARALTREASLRAAFAQADAARADLARQLDAAGAEGVRDKAGRQAEYCLLLQAYRQGVAFEAGAIAASADISGGLAGVTGGLASVRVAAERARAGVAVAAAASGQLTTSAEDIAVQVARSAQSAVEAAEAGRRTDRWVEELDSAARHIGDVVQLISDIASQTNLLALNATIEAARAGSAGRGFAVVAEEVKTLAAQTARATEEIAGQVAAMQSATQGSVDAVRDMSGRIEDISSLAADAAAAVQQQRAAADHLVKNRGVVVSGIAEVMAALSLAEHAAQSAAAGNIVVERIVAGLPRHRVQVHGIFDRLGLAMD